MKERSLGTLHDKANDTTRDTIEVVHAVIGCSRRVYDEMGFGLIESAYVGGLAYACRSAGLRVDREVSVPIYFDGVVVAN